MVVKHRVDNVSTTHRCRTLGMSKGAQYLSYKSSNIQMRKPVFWSTFEWPPQPCIPKLAPCKFASHLVVGTADITIK